MNLFSIKYIKAYESEGLSQSLLVHICVASALEAMTTYFVQQENNIRSSL